MNLKLLQSPSSTTGYSVPARAEWKGLTSAASPVVVREEDPPGPGRWHAPLLAFQRAGKQTQYYKAAGEKKT